MTKKTAKKAAKKAPAKKAAPRKSPAKKKAAKKVAKKAPAKKKAAKKASVKKAAPKKAAKKVAPKKAAKKVAVKKSPFKNGGRSANLGLAGAPPSPPAVAQMSIRFEFFSGQGNATVTLFRDGNSVGNSQTVHNGGTLVFQDVQHRDTISIDGTCAGTGRITFTGVGTNPAGPTTLPTGLILKGYTILLS